MKFEAIRMTRTSPGELAAEKPEPGTRLVTTSAVPQPFDAVDFLKKVKPGEYSNGVANILGTASTWAYSDADTLSRMMHRRAGFTWNETVAITEGNPALLTNTTAYLIQSEDRKVCILCYRGTELLNMVNWLSNASAKPELFYSSGHVHGGFFRAANAVHTLLLALGQSALKGGSICEAVAREKATWRDYLKDHPQCSGEERRRAEAEPDAPCRMPPPPRLDGPDVLEALYITGHSLGGAEALLAAAFICASPDAAPLREKLRGVYTYGQPMVGLQDFKDRFDRDLGKMLFRHVYRNDVIPALPARTMGPYVHLGTEYVSKGDEGWVPRHASTRQAITTVGAMSIAAMAWLQEQLVGISLLEHLSLRRSLGDHLPLNYQRTSMIAAPGTEIT